MATPVPLGLKEAPEIHVQQTELQKKDQQLHILATANNPQFQQLFPKAANNPEHLEKLAGIFDGLYWKLKGSGMADADIWNLFTPKAVDLTPNQTKIVEDYLQQFRAAIREFRAEGKPVQAINFHDVFALHFIHYKIDGDTRVMVTSAHEKNEPAARSALQNLRGHLDEAKGLGYKFDETQIIRDAMTLLSAAERAWLSDIAGKLGFKTSAFSQAGAATMGKMGMQAVVERIRSVDDLAKQKLEDMRKEDAEGKKLSADEKRKRLREDAAKMLKEEEEGKKTTKKEPEPMDLQQVTSIKHDMRQEVKLIESARETLSAKMPLEKAFNDPKFEEMFEQHRGEEVKETRKYFQSGMVPVKVLDAIANIRPPDVASYGPVSQLALLRAYRKTLEEYGQNVKAA